MYTALVLRSCSRFNHSLCIRELWIQSCWKKMKIWHFAILKLQRHHCKGLPSLSQDTPCLLLILHVSKCRVYNLCVWITTTSHDLDLPKHDWFRGNRRKKDLRYLIFFQVLGGSTKKYVYIYIHTPHTPIYTAIIRRPKSIHSDLPVDPFLKHNDRQVYSDFCYRLKLRLW